MYVCMCMCVCALCILEIIVPIWGYCVLHLHHSSVKKIIIIMIKGYVQRKKKWRQKKGSERGRIKK